MAQFIYEGPGHSLSLAGRNLTRGIPASLEGRAAEAASNHPDVSVYEPGAAPSSPVEGNYVELQARAKALGLPATGKKAELAKAIEAEENRLAAAASTTESCPIGCGDETRVELAADWRERVDAGESIAIAGCGNPWHYTEDGRPLSDSAVEALPATGDGAD